jgi:predicted DCC family thiol-disulfide oxidoreductase YuxK
MERHDHQHRLEFRDYNDPEVARQTPYDAAELAREMHVQAADGKWFAGYRAWMEVLLVLPKWRHVARIGSLPPMKWLGPAFYRLVAANRYRLQRRPSSRPGKCEHCHVPSR